MKITKAVTYFIFSILSLIATSCIEDGIDTSPSHQPQFSTDTLKLGSYFTGEPTPTRRFVIYNRYKKVMNISSIRFYDRDQRIFRINVDGQSGKEFSNIEIRPNDSIYVLVESTLPANGVWGENSVSKELLFTTNGIDKQVVIHATGEDIQRERGTIIETDTRFNATHPYQIYDSLVVMPGATLTLEPGARLYFHDKAELLVFGKLVSKGTPENPVTLTGDRRGNVVADISFDLMSQQWGGIYFGYPSTGNVMEFTEVRNTDYGVAVDSCSYTPALPALRLKNCRFRNTAGFGLQAGHTGIFAEGCEFAEAGCGALLLKSGEHTFNNCTFSNYYLFAIPTWPLVHLEPLTAETDGDGEPADTPVKADFNNCILYGMTAEMNSDNLDDSRVYFRNTLFKSTGSDDDHFINCLWQSDPLFHTVREDYIFDYRPKPGSPAIEAADKSYIPEGCDFYGTPRSGAIGAHEPKSEP